MMTLLMGLSPEVAQRLEPHIKIDMLAKMNAEQRNELIVVLACSVKTATVPSRLRRDIGELVAAVKRLQWIEQAIEPVRPH